LFSLDLFDLLLHHGKNENFQAQKATIPEPTQLTTPHANTSMPHSVPIEQSLSIIDMTHAATVSTRTTDPALSVETHNLSDLRILTHCVHILAGLESDNEQVVHHPVSTDMHPYYNPAILVLMGSVP
jgi:DNA topoisomerase VI subunit B